MGEAVTTTKKSRKSKKQPLERRVPIVLDDECLDALDASRTELATAEEKADLERERLFRLAKSVDMAPADALELYDAITARLDKTLQPLRGAVAATEAAVRANTTTYVMRSMGRTAYRELLDEHPPREEDHAAARKDTGLETATSNWNDDTFPPALVLATCVEPVLSAEDVEEMFTSWNHAELLDIVAAAVAVNTQSRSTTLR